MSVFPIKEASVPSGKGLRMSKPLWRLPSGKPIKTPIEVVLFGSVGVSPAPYQQRSRQNKVKKCSD